MTSVATAARGPVASSDASRASEKPVVLVPFVCPVCTAANGVQLIALSRKGGVECAGCKKWLRAADVMRAMHAPRTAK